MEPTRPAGSGGLGLVGTAATSRPLRIPPLAKRPAATKKNATIPRHGRERFAARASAQVASGPDTLVAASRCCALRYRRVAMLGSSMSYTSLRVGRMPQAAGMLHPIRATADIDRLGSDPIPAETRDEGRAACSAHQQELT